MSNGKSPATTARGRGCWAHGSTDHAGGHAATPHELRHLKHSRGYIGGMVGACLEYCAVGMNVLKTDDRCEIVVDDRGSMQK